MCLGVPGKVMSIEENPLEEYDLNMAMGKVSFGGIVKEMCLVYVPEVKVGDYVIVHAGFALNVLNEEEAMEVFEMLSQMEDLAASEMSS
jgi:hydrogenase expression/formation protein HypC